MSSVPGWVPVPIFAPGGAQAAVVSADDVLWLGRMVVGEAGYRATEAQARALVSTIVRRWFQVDHLSGRARSLLELTRAYSTPLQASRRAEAGGRPAEIQDLPWREIPEPIRRVVVATMRGELPLTAPAAVHWAAPSVYAGHGLSVASAADRARTAPAAVEAREAARGNAGARYVPVPGAPVADNVFSSTSASRTAPEPSIGRTGGQAAAPTGLLALAVALVFFFVGCGGAAPVTPCGVLRVGCAGARRACEIVETACGGGAPCEAAEGADAR